MKPHTEQSADMPTNINVHVNRPGLVRRTGTVLGLAAAATVALNYLPGDIVEQEIDQPESLIAVTWTRLAPVDIQCFVGGTAELDSKARTRLAVANKKLGPTGYKAWMQATAKPLVCFDGSSMEIDLDNETGKQVVTIDRASQQVNTEYDDISINTDVEGSFAEMGDALFSIGDAIGIDGPKEYVNQKKADLGKALEKATKNSLETDCIDELGDNLDELIEKGVYLQAKNRGIDPLSVSVRFVGETPKPSPIDFGTEAGRFGFALEEDGFIENVSCNVAPGAFDDVEGLTKSGPSVKVTTFKKAGAN